MNQDDHYLYKCKAAGVRSAIIALKLGLSEADVEKRWRQMIADAAAQDSNGYLLLIDRFKLALDQYESMGRSLAIVANATGHILSTEELRAYVSNDPEETLKKLTANVICLPKFVPPPEPPIKKEMKPVA